VVPHNTAAPRQLPISRKASITSIRSSAFNTMETPSVAPETG
jgi:hypothetical protein